ncbi:hypothetical protein JX266_004089 [Neoarthrinium moseri]|nr:hypothetical protein JX266_004089 [Neoarthrinium moseri]
MGKERDARSQGPEARQQTARGADDDDPTAKRKRVASTETIAHPPSKKARLAADLSLPAAKDTRALEAVEAKYDVQIHSVISSSKIQKKVTSVLRHLTPRAKAADDAPPTATGKPRVSVLRAKAADAGKLISIAEIAKREIAQLEDGQGTWFQYIGLGGEVKETPKENKRDKTIVQDTVLGGKGTNEEEESDEDDEDDFEYMKTPFERAIEGRPQKQRVAIMSLFLARVPVEELKIRYGGQTNEDAGAKTAKDKT